MNTYTEVPILASQFPARYAELCALRDAVNAANAPIEAALAEVVSQMETLRVQAEKLAAEEETIVSELNGVQGSPADIGGYFQPVDELADKVMRPSSTLNEALASL